jgi:ribosomal protein L44E
MFAGSIANGKDLSRYLEYGLLEPHNLRARHDQLAAEMIRRGYRHDSDLREFDSFVAGSVDVVANKRELTLRCLDCAELVVLDGRNRADFTIDEILAMIGDLLKGRI